MPTSGTTWLQVLAVAALAAVIGGAFAAASLGSDWSQIVGATLQAAATAGAVFFTVRQTRQIFLDERRDERERDRETRAAEIHRALSLGSFSLLQDIINLNGTEYFLRHALDHPTEEQRFWHYQRVFAGLNMDSSTQRLETLIRTIGDVEAQVCRILIAYMTAAERFGTSKPPIERMDLKRELPAGWTASLVEVDLKLIRQQRQTAQTAIFLIDDYLARHGLPPVPEWHNVELSDEQDAEYQRQGRPIDIEAFAARTPPK